MSHFQKKDSLQKKVDARDLLRLSKCLDYSKLDELGVLLGLNANQIYCAHYNSQGYLPRVCVNLLLKWRDVSGKNATLEQFIHVLNVCKSKGHKIDFANINILLQDY